MEGGLDAFTGTHLGVGRRDEGRALFGREDAQVDLRVHVGRDRVLGVLFLGDLVLGALLGLFGLGLFGLRAARRAAKSECHGEQHQGNQRLLHLEAPQGGSRTIHHDTPYPGASSMQGATALGAWIFPARPGAFKSREAGEVKRRAICETNRDPRGVHNQTRACARATSFSTVLPVRAGAPTTRGTLMTTLTTTTESTRLALAPQPWLHPHRSPDERI